MTPLALFNEGVLDYFPMCGIFRGDFLWEFCKGFFADGVLDHFPVCGMMIRIHALVIDKAHATEMESLHRVTPLMFA